MIAPPGRNGGCEGSQCRPAPTHDGGDGRNDARYAFTARPGRKPLRQASLVGAATSTGAEHTQLCERDHPEQTAGATSLTERISAGACSQQPVSGYEALSLTDPPMDWNQGT
jgi:hypothetical protein